MSQSRSSIASIIEILKLNSTENKSKREKLSELFCLLTQVLNTATENIVFSMQYVICSSIRVHIYYRVLSFMCKHVHGVSDFN